MIDTLKEKLGYFLRYSLATLKGIGMILLCISVFAGLATLIMSFFWALIHFPIFTAIGVGICLVIWGGWWMAKDLGWYDEIK